MSAVQVAWRMMSLATTAFLVSGFCFAALGTAYFGIHGWLAAIGAHALLASIFCARSVLILLEAEVRSDAPASTPARATAGGAA